MTRTHRQSTYQSRVIKRVERVDPKVEESSIIITYRRHTATQRFVQDQGTEIERRVRRRSNCLHHHHQLEKKSSPRDRPVVGLDQVFLLDSSSFSKFLLLRSSLPSTTFRPTRFERPREESSSKTHGETERETKTGYI